MMERQWAAECARPEQRRQTRRTHERRLSIWCVPRSRCQTCGHQIRWYENIPVLSYLFLRGKCSACKTAISMRYPLVELATGLLFAWCAWRWGWTHGAGLVRLFCRSGGADLDRLGHHAAARRPDAAACCGPACSPRRWAWTDVPLAHCGLGRCGRLLSLWLVYWAFKLATGKEGMGYGDFKLFAALGAWFGWQALVPIILMASVIGALVGIGMKLPAVLREGGVCAVRALPVAGRPDRHDLWAAAILRVVGL
jgi:leader peptidase (prepilin peptidase)/N-methyltransferase